MMMIITKFIKVLYLIVINILFIGFILSLFGLLGYTSIDFVSGNCRNNLCIFLKHFYSLLLFMYIFPVVFKFFKLDINTKIKLKNKILSKNKLDWKLINKAYNLNGLTPIEYPLSESIKIYLTRFWVVCVKTFILYVPVVTMGFMMGIGFPYFFWLNSIMLIVILSAALLYQFDRYPVKKNSFWIRKILASITPDTKESK